MIKSKKIYVLILALSLACTGTYSSYSYFTSQSVEGNNKITIGELEPEEGLQELVKANINGDTLELKFSKRLFYNNGNIAQSITGDNYILDNTETTIKGNSLYIKKINGQWIIPDNKNEKNLPKISIENFEDRFGNKIKAQDIYLYKSKDFILSGNVEYVLADKNSKTDAVILASSVAGINGIEGVNANVQLAFNNSKDEIVNMTIKCESEIEYEELANNKNIKIIPSYGSEEYSEWVGDTLQVYICYDKSYNQEELQSVINNVINLNLSRRIRHEFEINNIKVEFADSTKLIKPVLGNQGTEGIFMNAKNTILGKNTRCSISIKSVANTTGRFKVKIIDNEGLNIEETFISIKGETPQELMDKIKLQISSKVDTKKYMFTSKEDNTRFDITSKLGVNTGLNVEIEIL